MFDFDKWTPLQWAMLFGSAIGGVLVTFFGRFRTKPSDEDHERDIEIVKLRDQVRDAAIKQECHLMVGQAQDAMGAALKATRDSFDGEFRELRASLERLDERLRDLEIGNSRRR